jgi:diguanylate cyclase
LIRATEAQLNTEFQTNIWCENENRVFNCRVSDLITDPKYNEPQTRILLFKDVTDSARLLEKMEELATIDPLTHLYNRRYFMDHAAKTVASLERTGGKLSLLIADLDLFKQINDTFGHLTGDAVIHAVAEVITRNIRPSDIAARFGGEEFVCLFPNTDIKAASVIAERIRECIERLQIPTNGELLADIKMPQNSTDTRTEQSCPIFSPQNGIVSGITASFGVAGTDSVFGPMTVTFLVSKADKALYESKKNGRNRITTG